MNLSIAKNWFLALFLGIFVIFAIGVAITAVSDARRGLRLKQTHNDLKWIGMALHQYHDMYGGYPPVVVRDAMGNPRHSWRSIIQRQLALLVTTKDDFRGYNLSEPWDSPGNNRAVLRHRFGTHPYQFLAVVGPNTAWPAIGTRDFTNSADGSSSPILVVAVRKSGTHWNQPVDAVVTETGSWSVNGQPLDLSSDIFVLTENGVVEYAADGLRNDKQSTLPTVHAGDLINNE